MTHKGSRSSVMLTSSNTAHMSALTWLWAALGWKLDGLMLRLPSILLYWSAITVASSSPKHKHRKISVIFLTFQTQTAELYSSVTFSADVLSHDPPEQVPVLRYPLVQGEHLAMSGPITAQYCVRCRPIRGQ